MCFSNAGIDANQFGAHSTRSASTSAAKRSGLDITTIIRAAGWSNASTFARFYSKPIEHSPDANFGKAVLSSVLKYSLYAIVGVLHYTLTYLLFLHYICCFEIVVS